MTKISAKGATIAVDDSGGTPRQIETDCISYEIEYTAPPKDVTGFTEGSQNFIPGVRVIGVTLDVLWNVAATTGAFTVLQPVIGQTTSITLTILPAGGGQKTFSGEFMCDGFKPAGKSDGSPVQLGSVHFSVNGGVAPVWS